MGLSKEERIEQLFWCVKNIHDLREKLDVQEDHPVGLPFETKNIVAGLLTVIDGLWHNLLGGTRDSTYWILGGSLSNPVEQPTSPWGAAVAHHCGKQAEEYPSFTSSPTDYHLGVLGLLEHDSRDRGFRGAVYSLYSATESMVYALRRYDDALLLRYRALNKSISDLQGFCFRLFSEDETYAKAYVLNRVLMALYGCEDLKPYLKNNYDVARMLSRPMIDGNLKECIVWDRQCLKPTMTAIDWVCLLLQVCGRRFRYEHSLNSIIRHLCKINPGISEEDIQRVKTEFAACQKAHDTREDPAQYVRDRTLRAASIIHGHAIYSKLAEPVLPKQQDDQPDEGRDD